MNRTVVHSNAVGETSTINMSHNLTATVNLFSIGKQFLMHLGLSEPSTAYEMKKHLVSFADLSYSFCVNI